MTMAKKLTITLTRSATICIETHERCNNGCEHLVIARSDGPNFTTVYRGTCSLFQAPVRWDKRFRSNGYKRCMSCKKATKEL